MTLTVGSLFSGIGGLDLGLERAGMKVVWHSEIDPFASKVLKKHWPDVPNHGDIKQIDWSKIERPDVICGGYPCQPFSHAGKRNGTDDPRHLWPWVRNAISGLRPKYAILENVRGHVSMGGLSVIGDLANIGYNAEWRIISAASVGANHRRDRLIIVAHPNNTGNRTSEHDTHKNKSATIQRREIFTFAEPCRFSSIPQWWETEPDVGRVADGVPNWLDRIRGLGNAVVPQVAEVIGRMIVEHEKSI
jgi:DNA (cytosine-5)-methyltransferase 1